MFEKLHINRALIIDIEEKEILGRIIPCRYRLIKNRVESTSWGWFSIIVK
jgi:hypothetical protein